MSEIESSRILNEKVVAFCDAQNYLYKIHIAEKSINVLEKSI